MTATNHAITGALIATAVHNPWAAVPLAFFSHFLLDMLPHYGVPPDTNLGTWRYLRILCADLTVAAGVLIFLLVSGYSHALLLVACAIAAASPDALWGYYFYYEVIAKKPRVKTWLARLLGTIQWGEFSKGFLVETPWAILTFVLLLNRMY